MRSNGGVFRRMASPGTRTVVREIFLMALAGGLAIAIDESAIPWFVAAAILGAILLILCRVDQEASNPNLTGTTAINGLPAEESKPVEEDARSPTYEHSCFLLATLSVEIKWMANRSAFRWIEPFSAIAYPIEHAEIAKRESRVYRKLSELGVKAPQYGDVGYRDFWTRLYFIAKRRDLAKARTLLDGLTAAAE